MLDIFKEEFQRVCKYPIEVNYKESEFSFHPSENSLDIIKIILDITNKHDLGYIISYHKQHGVVVEFY